eukprot:351335-Chlamydomonas_euryale.AAC.13
MDVWKHLTHTYQYAHSCMDVWMDGICAGAHVQRRGPHGGAEAAGAAERVPPGPVSQAPRPASLGAAAHVRARAFGDAGVAREGSIIISSDQPVARRCCRSDMCSCPDSYQGFVRHACVPAPDSHQAFVRHACVPAPDPHQGFVRHASAAGKNSFKEMRKALRLTVPEEEGLTGGPDGTDFSPSDLSFLYKGYAPLSIRLVERALEPASWSSIPEVCISPVFITCHPLLASVADSAASCVYGP